MSNDSPHALGDSPSRSTAGFCITVIRFRKTNRSPWKHSLSLVLFVFLFTPGRAESKTARHHLQPANLRVLRGCQGRGASSALRLSVPPICSCISRRWLPAPREPCPAPAEPAARECRQPSPDPRVRDPGPAEHGDSKQRSPSTASRPGSSCPGRHPM